MQQLIFDTFLQKLKAQIFKASEIVGETGVELIRSSIVFLFLISQIA